MMNAFNVILVKNYYINSIPAALREAARIDGGSEFGIFWKIVMPLSIPINATIGLMAGLLPVLIAYPFLQKYFVKGITVGAVKECDRA